MLTISELDNFKIVLEKKSSKNLEMPNNNNIGTKIEKLRISLGKSSRKSSEKHKKNTKSNL